MKHQLTKRKSDLSPVEKLFPEERISGSAQEILMLLGKFGIRNLAYDKDPGRNPGYIFRGEADFRQPLQSSLERKLREELGDNGKIDQKQLKSREKELVTNFVRGDGGSVAAIIDRQRGRTISEPPSSVFWWLSVMQHYRQPTRLIDFTKDIRFALFFAIQQVEPDKRKDKSNRLSDDLIVWCFPCKDLKFENDPDHNKCPFKPSRDLPAINMHVAIGCLMELSWMQSGGPLFKKHFENRNGQRWGWDRPYVQNPRIEFQKGMFVYPYDYPERTLRKEGDSWLVQNLRAKSEDRFNMGGLLDNLSAMRIRIDNRHLGKLKEHLAKLHGLTTATVYVDYARAVC